MKKVPISTKPVYKPAPDAWVENRTQQVEPEAFKRLTLDIPESLHREIKAQCALRGRKIAEELRELLLEKYGKS